MAKGANNTPNTRRRKVDRGNERIIKEKFMEERVHNAPPIVAKTQHQKDYLRLLRTTKLVIAKGDAGVGKTWVASAMAADLYLKGSLNKIIVARPYVQMGKYSGARPGSDYEKLLPYCRNMLDTIRHRIGDARYQLAIDKGDIELQALESIRGRSFDGPCWIICDEMQNATIDEVKSIVTRIGEEATAIFCGDTRQSDIKGPNGLDWIVHMINKYRIDNCGIVEFTSDDCVRSGLVRDFLKAIEKEYDQTKKS